MRLLGWPSSSACLRIGQVADWVDVAHLAIGDEAGEQCPVFCADLMTGEECVLARKGNFSDLVFDRVGVQFQTTVFQEPRQKCARVYRMSSASLWRQGWKASMIGAESRLVCRCGSANRLLDDIELSDLAKPSAIGEPSFSRRFTNRRRACVQQWTSVHGPSDRSTLVSLS